jgi:hypothetical protein
MFNRNDLVRIFNRLYFYLGKNLVKDINFDKFYSQNLIKNNSLEEKRKAFLFSSKLLLKRNRSLIKFFFENILLLLFFESKRSISLFDFYFFRLLYIWNIFNLYVAKIKNIPNIQQLKMFLISKLIMKINKFSLKFIYFHYLKNNIVKNKSEFNFKINLFFTNKNKFIFCLKSLKDFLNNEKWKKNYIFFILKELKRNYLYNFKSLYSLMNIKKKRFNFIPLFLWVYKVFDKISLNYWLIFLIFWLRSFVFYYLNIITYIFPPYKNLIRTSIYSSRYFLNSSKNIIIEKKLSFNIYNKIINNFYILRSFSSLLNYNYFQSLKFQHLKEIFLYQDFFSNWHLNINKFSKFINIHYNEYLYNHINKYYFVGGNKSLNFPLNYEKKNTSNSETFFNFEEYQKEKNIKNIIFSRIKNDNKIKLYYYLKTKVPYLNKNLVYPSYIAISAADHVEMNKEKSIEFKIEQKERTAKKLKMTKKLKDLSFINDLKLIINSEKLWKLLDARRKERLMMQKRKKFWKMKKKIKFFGYENLKKKKLDAYVIANEKESFLSEQLNKSFILSNGIKQSFDVVPYTVKPTDTAMDAVSVSVDKKKNKRKIIKNVRINLKYLNKLLKEDKNIILNKELKSKDKIMNKKDNSNTMDPNRILATYVEKFTKIKFEMLNERDRRRNEKNNKINKYEKYFKNNKLKKNNKKFYKYEKYFKNKRFNKFSKYNRLRSYNFFNNNKFSSFIKRTKLSKNSKLFKFIKHAIFSRINNVGRNNIIDKLKIFRKLDDKYKLTKYGKTDRFNSFYKFILLHRYINRYKRLRKDPWFIKKSKFRNKYENTLNLKFCHIWNSVLKQYSKKFLLPTRFIAARPYGSFRLFDTLNIDSFYLKKSEGKMLNSKVNFVKNDYFLENFLNSFVNNDLLSSYYYNFFLHNSSSWHIMENYKSFYSFFLMKLENMTGSLQLMIFKNFVLSCFLNFFWKSFDFFNLNIFLKKNTDNLNNKVYFWGLLNFFRKNKYNHLNYILLNLNVRLLKYNKFDKIFFFKKNVIKKNNSFISEIKYFISEINELFFFRIKEALYFFRIVSSKKRKSFIKNIKLLKFFYLKILIGLYFLKSNKKKISSFLLYKIYKSEFRKWKNLFFIFKKMIFFYLLTNKKKSNRSLALLKKMKKREFRNRILKKRTDLFSIKIKSSCVKGLESLGKYYKQELFFFIFKLTSEKWEFNLELDIDLDRLFILGNLLKISKISNNFNSCQLFLSHLNKNINKHLDKFDKLISLDGKGIKFSSKKGRFLWKNGKRLLRNPEAFLYVVKILKNKKNFLGKNLVLLKHIKKLKRSRRKFVIIKLLYKLKGILVFMNVLKYFIINCVGTFLIQLKKKKNNLNLLFLLKNIFFSSKHFLKSRLFVKNIWYFFLGFFHFLKFNSHLKGRKKNIKKLSFKGLFRWCYFFFFPKFKIIEKENSKGRIYSKEKRCFPKNFFFSLKWVAHLIKNLFSRVLKPNKKQKQNKIKWKKKILKFIFKRGSFYYYKKMFRWHYFITKDSYKVLGLHFFNFIKSKNEIDAIKIELKKRILNRKKNNQKLVMGMQSLNLKRKRMVNFFLPFRYFSKFFPSNVFIRTLKSRDFLFKDKEKILNYLKFFFNQNSYVNFWRNKKEFTLKQRPLFYKVNSFLSKVLVSKTFPMIFKVRRNNLKKRRFFKELTFRKIKGNKNMVFWFNYLKKQEFNFPRKRRTSQDRFKVFDKNRVYGSLFSPKFFKGHYVNFSDKKFFAPLQLNAFSSLIYLLL